MPRKSQNIELNQKNLIPFKEYRVEEFCAKASQQLYQNTDIKTTPSKQQTLLRALIKPVKGLFAYISGLSGDFLKLVHGFWVENGKKAVRECRIPVLGSHAPVQECRSPVQERHSPVQENHFPVLDCHSPLLDCSSPVQERRSPALDCHAPVQEYRAPVLEHHAPVQECRPPEQEKCTFEQENRTYKQLIFPPLLNSNFQNQEQAIFNSEKGLFVQENHFLTLLNCFTRVSSLFWNFTNAGPRLSGESYPLQFSRKN